MIDIQSLIDTKNVGATFFVTPKELEATEEEFDRFARLSLQRGGGDRFTVADKPPPHKDSMTGRYDVIALVRDEE